MLMIRDLIIVNLSFACDKILNFFYQSCSFCFSGDTLGSFVYVPCEVMKQRMQVQGSKTSWNSIVGKDTPVKSGVAMYGYYTGMFQAGCSIWREQGLSGLYTG